MQLSDFTLQEKFSHKNKLYLQYNYGLEIMIRKHWFITSITVKKYDNEISCIGFNSKDLVSQFEQGKFDGCINRCLAKM